MKNEVLEKLKRVSEQLETGDVISNRDLQFIILDAFIEITRLKNENAVLKYKVENPNSEFI